MSAAGQVVVDLERSSWIEGRGVRHVDWSVRVNDSWVPIKELRNVGQTMAEPDFSFEDEVEEMRVIPPGCQYRTTYHPRLAVGTRVQRRISVPMVLPSPAARAPETPDVAFRQLMAAGVAPKLPLKTTFTDYRVTARGLVTEERWQRQQRRVTGRDGTTSRQNEPGSGGSPVVSGAEIEALARRLAKVG
jgi:hypothetical protein